MSTSPANARHATARASCVHSVTTGTAVPTASTSGGLPGNSRTVAVDSHVAISSSSICSLSLSSRSRSARTRRPSPNPAATSKVTIGMLRTNRVGASAEGGEFPEEPGRNHPSSPRLTSTFPSLNAFAYRALDVRGATDGSEFSAVAVAWAGPSAEPIAGAAKGAAERASHGAVLPSRGPRSCHARQRGRTLSSSAARRAEHVTEALGERARHASIRRTARSRCLRTSRSAGRLRGKSDGRQVSATASKI